MKFETFLKSLVDSESTPVNVPITEALAIKNMVVEFMHTRLKNIREDNSHAVDNEPESDVQEELLEYRNAKTFLVSLKTEIAIANSKSGAIALIFAQEEHKDEHTSISTIPTMHGKHTTSVGRYDEDSAEVVYVAHLRKKELEERKAWLSLRLRQIDSQLATINASTKISIGSL